MHNNLHKKDHVRERAVRERISFFHSEYPRFEREVPQNAEENIEILSIITNIF